MSKILKAFALIVGLGVMQNATASSLLVNGGFELPVEGPPDYAAYNVPAGSALITGWTIVQGNVDLTKAVDYGPGANTLDPASVQDIDLTGDVGQSKVYGGLSQAFATTPGQTYELTFDYSHNNGSYSPEYAAQVTLSDANTATTIVTYEVSQLYGAAPWLASSQIFTATSDSTLLTFIDTEGAFNAGIYLDDVDVEPLNGTTPLPGALPLFASGLGMLSLLARRSKKATAMAPACDQHISNLFSADPCS